MTDSIRSKTDQRADRTVNQDSEDAGSQLTRLPHRRTDWYSARTIEEGVRLQAQEGTQAAAAFLKHHSIVADITIRTLLHPDQRRSS